MKQWVLASLSAFALGLVLVHPAARAASDDKGAIEGRVFHDKDGDGIRDAGEEGLEGVEVKLSGKLRRTAETDRSGKFSFDDLGDGAYDVTVSLDEGWTAVKDFTVYKDLEVEGATLNDVDFALQSEDDAAADEDAASDTGAVAGTTGSTGDDEASSDETGDDTAGTDDESAGDDTDATDDSTADDSSDAADDAAATTDEDAGDETADDSTDATAGHAAHDDAAGDDVVAMDRAAADLIAGLSGADLDPAVIAALQRALDSAKASGDQSDVTKALEAALATLPKDVQEKAKAAATDAAGGHDGDEAKDSKPAEGAMAAAPQSDAKPAGGMPETGGGALALGGLLAAGLAALGGAGRWMERRRA